MLQVGERSFAGKTRVSSTDWHYLTMARDKHHVRVYLDGRTEPEIDAGLDSRKTPKRLLFGSGGISTTTFDGKIDEVAVYDRALTPEEVTAQFDAAEIKLVE